jgi:hypothetical protein
MPDLRPLLRSILQQTKLQYRLGPSNLMFAEPSSAREHARNRDAIKGQWQLLRYGTVHGMSRIGPELGRHQLEQSVTASTCKFESSRALLLCQQKPELRRLVNALYLLGTAPGHGGDHALAVVREASTSASPASFSSIQQMCEDPSASGLWILDPWASLVCTPAEYPNQMYAAAIRARALGLGVGTSSEQVRGFDHLLWVSQLLQSAPEVYEYRPDA